MRYTLLEIVQQILSSMDSDSVNSINDTIESQQVALLLKGVYYDCASDINLLENKGLIKLAASGDSGLPVYMTLPSEATKIESIRYNHYDPDVDTTTNANYQMLTPLDFDDFIDMMTSYHNETADVAEMSFEFNGQTFSIMYRTDKHPQYYTTINNRIVLFDSINTDIDTTLQSDKTLCVGYTYPTFEMEDTFEPNLDPTQFSYYVNKAKDRAFAELKQSQNANASGEARRQKIIIQKRKFRTPERPAIERAPRYGRK